MAANGPDINDPEYTQETRKGKRNNTRACSLFEFDNRVRMTEHVPISPLLGRSHMELGPYGGRWGQPAVYT